MKGKEKCIKVIIEIFKDKDCLFLENDFGLYHTVGVMEDILIDNKIKYHTILDISNTSTESILEQCNMHDVIIWESQYVTDKSKELLSLIESEYILGERILVECYIGEPRFYYKPDGVRHRIFNASFPEDDSDMWTLYELKDDNVVMWNKSNDEL